MKQNKNAEESRYDAREIGKHAATLRSKGVCELCGIYCAFISEAHHIVPVADGGHGMEGNLLILCPNCHAIAEKMKTSMVNNPHFHDWVRGTYGEGYYMRLGTLALGIEVGE